MLRIFFWLYQQRILYHVRGNGGIICHHGDRKSFGDWHRSALHRISDIPIWYLVDCRLCHADDVAIVDKSLDIAREPVLPEVGNGERLIAYEMVNPRGGEFIITSHSQIRQLCILLVRFRDRVTVCSLCPAKKGRTSSKSAIVSRMFSSVSSFSRMPQTTLENKPHL